MDYLCEPTFPSPLPVGTVGQILAGGSWMQGMGAISVLTVKKTREIPSFSPLPCHRDGGGVC